MNKLIKNIEPNISFDRIIEEKRKYKPVDRKIRPITKGKKKGPNYTMDECIVLVYMTLYPGGIKDNRKMDIQLMSEIFNRTTGSINLTMNNAQSVLWNTGKLVNASNNIKKACKDYKNLSKNEFDRVVGNILINYDYNKR